MRRKKIGTRVTVVLCTVALAFGLTAAGVGGASGLDARHSRLDPATTDASPATTDLPPATSLTWTNRYPDSSAGVRATNHTDDGTLVAGGRGDDGWVAKLDESGGTAWQTTVTPGTSNVRDAGHFDAIVPAEDGYLLVGSIYLTAEDETIGWAAKVSDSGELRWNRTYRGNEWSEELADGVQTADGGFLLAGTRNVSSPDTGQAWLLRIDGGGEPQWERTYGAADRTRFSAIAPADGGYLAAGVSKDVRGSTGAWAVAVDQRGDVRWQEQYEGASPETFSSVVPTDGGHLLATENGWVVELDERGATQWERRYDGISIASATPTDDGYLLAGTDYRSGVLMEVGAEGTTRWRWSRGGQDRAFDFLSAVQRGDGSYLVGGSLDDGSWTGWAGELSVSTETTTSTTSATQLPTAESTETTESAGTTGSEGPIGETTSTTRTPTSTTTTESAAGGGTDSDTEGGGSGDGDSSRSDDTDGSDAGGTGDSTDVVTTERTGTTTTAEAAATATGANEEPATATESAEAATEASTETTVFETEKAGGTDSRGQPGFGVAATIVGLVFLVLAAAAVFVRGRS